MESLVLCPEELCLGPSGCLRLVSPLLGLSPTSPADLTIWTADSVDKGTRFLPWKGTSGGDKLPVFNKLPDFDVSTNSKSFN
jgi:hypothetical protein